LFLVFLLFLKESLTRVRKWFIIIWTRNETESESTGTYSTIQ